MAITRTKKVKTTRVRAQGVARASARQPGTRPATVSKLELRSVQPSLTVNDLEASVAWYRDTLGLVVGERWEHEGKLVGAELKAGKVILYLSQDDWGKGTDRVKGEGFRLYGTTAQDVDRLAAKIRERGGRLLQEPHDEPWGGRAFTVADPDGYKLTITSA